MERYKHISAEIKLSLESDKDIEYIVQICEALGNETRLKILKILSKPPHRKTLPELSREMNIPKTTLLHHLVKMEDASLVSSFYKTTDKTTQKYFGRDAKNLFVSFYYDDKQPPKQTAIQTQSLGVGQFSDFTGTTFGFTTKTDGFTFMAEDCFSPLRFDAQLIFTSRGVVTYHFNNTPARHYNITELLLSLEICSEAPYYDNNYKSDITFWINDKEVATYFSDGDYGDRRGFLTPQWWSSENTQYGKLVNLSITDNGVFLNGSLVNTKLKLDDLNLQKGNKVAIKIGNKDTAESPGGFNIFGKNFGDYPQDITLSFKYDDTK